MGTDDHSPARTIALSDGVFGIALTLLVLTIHVPTADELTHSESVVGAVQDAWPFLLAYVAAFITIGVTWLNHHAAFARIARVDYRTQWLNLLLLLAVSFMPVPTAFYASALSAGPFTDAARLAAVVFIASSMLRQVIWVVLWHHIRRHPDLLKAGVDSPRIRAQQRRAVMAATLDAAGTVVSFAIPLVAAALTAALAIVFARGAQRARADNAAAQSSGSAKEDVDG